MHEQCFHLGIRKLIVYDSIRITEESEHIMAVNIKWNDYQPTLSHAFSDFRNDRYLHDVTLMSDDHQHFTAHKLVLSASSQYFKKIFQHTSNHQHQMICVDGLSSDLLSNILDFIYNGQAKILQTKVDKFLTVARRFKLNGVSLDEIDKDTDELENKKEPMFIKAEVNIIEDEFVFEETENKKKDIDKGIEVSNQSDQNSETPVESVKVAFANKSKKCEEKDAKPITKTKFDNDLKCNTCNIPFNNKTELKLHKEKHKVYMCTTCDYKTYNSQVIKEHERIHTGEKPLVCTWCGKGFRQKRTLTNHERLHTGEKPFQCIHCDSKFAQQNSLKSHMLVHHKDKNVRPSKILGKQKNSETAKQCDIEKLDSLMEEFTKVDNMIEKINNEIE